MNRWTYTACLAGLLAMSLGQAKAATYEMDDHPDSLLWTTNGQGPYGYRLDNFSNTLFSVGDNILTTSAANVVINFDPDNLAAGATVTGTIQMTYRSSNYQVD